MIVPAPAEGPPAHQAPASCTPPDESSSSSSPRGKASASSSTVKRTIIPAHEQQRIRPKPPSRKVDPTKTVGDAARRQRPVAARVRAAALLVDPIVISKNRTDTGTRQMVVRGKVVANAKDPKNAAPARPSEIKFKTGAEIRAVPRAPAPRNREVNNNSRTTTTSRSHRPSARRQPDAGGAGVAGVPTILQTPPATANVKSTVKPPRTRIAERRRAVVLSPEAAGASSMLENFNANIELSMQNFNANVVRNIESSMLFLQNNFEISKTSSVLDDETPAPPPKEDVVNAEVTPEETRTQTARARPSHTTESPAAVVLAGGGRSEGRAGAAGAPEISAFLRSSSNNNIEHQQQETRLPVAEESESWSRASRRTELPRNRASRRTESTPWDRERLLPPLRPAPLREDRLLVSERYYSLSGEVGPFNRPQRRRATTRATSEPEPTLEEGSADERLLVRRVPVLLPHIIVPSGFSETTLRRQGGKPPHCSPQNSSCVLLQMCLRCVVFGDDTLLTVVQARASL